ncbi:hypothetical protein [Hyella patelloides]|nr:hypothetical protein [Hyella patelloides]
MVSRSQFPKLSRALTFWNLLALGIVGFVILGTYDGDLFRASMVAVMFPLCCMINNMIAQHAEEKLLRGYNILTKYVSSNCKPPNLTRAYFDEAVALWNVQKYFLIMVPIYFMTTVYIDDALRYEMFRSLGLATPLIVLIGGYMFIGFVFIVICLPFWFIGYLWQLVFGENTLDEKWFDRDIARQHLEKWNQRRDNKNLGG